MSPISPDRLPDSLVRVPSQAAALRLARPGPLVLKAGLATGLAMLADRVTGNPDHVSSTFVAMLCLTPLVWLGLRRAAEQAVGALIGGIWGVLALALSLEPPLAVPLAVALTTGTWLGIGRDVGPGFASAAFTALFVPLVPFGGPLETAGVRVLAIVTGAGSGFAVNALVSGRVARKIFDRRVLRVREHVRDHLATAILYGPEAINSVFASLAEVDNELELAIEELRWRRASDEDALDARRREVRALRHLAHTAAELFYLTGEDHDERFRLASWVLDGPQPLEAGELPPDPVLLARLQYAQAEIDRRSH